MPTNDDSEQESFECRICEYATDSRRGLKIHKGRMHASQLPANYNTSSKGYELWEGCAAGERYSVYVHRLLAVHKYGLDSLGDNHVHHKNEIPWANWPDNIELKDPSTHLRDHMHIPTEEIIAELRRVAAELGETPGQTDMEERGRYAYTLYYDRFDSWDEAIEAAGLDPIQRKIPEEDLIDDLLRLADEHGRPPTQAMVNEYGEFGKRVYVGRFGGWDRALAEAGLYDGLLKPITEEKLIGELRRLADELGHTPVGSEMNEHGRSNTSAFRTVFGKWSDAKKVAFGDNST